MANPFFSGRIPPGLADKIDAHLFTTGETRSELLIRLLRAEVSDDKDNNNSDNITDNKNDDILSDLITRVQKLEEAINNKSDNVVARTTDNKTDNISIGLAFHEDDDNPDNREKSLPVDDKFDNKEELVTTDDKFDNREKSLPADNNLDNKGELVTTDDNPDNKEEPLLIDNKLDNDRAVILQENRIATDLNPTQLADLIKIHECKTVSKAKSKKLLDLGMISEIGGDSILTKLGEAILAKHQT